MAEQNKILSFETPKEHYAAEACIVWCYDDRFTKLLEEFVKSRGYKNYDLIKLAGGAKSLAAPESEAERLFVLKQIRTSINLHHTLKVILMCHEDCGAYGGKKAFSGDQDEHEKICADLKEAVHILENNLPKEVGVEMIFADFGGIEKA
jgi:carbonic anhydrase